MNKISLLVVSVSMVLLLLAWQRQSWNLFVLSPNVIRWVTQSEEDNFGYDVYRGPSVDGPFTRINNRTLLGAGTTDLPQRYQFSDDSINADTVYWYYVETISLTGKRSRLTPVYPSRPKTVSLW